MFNQLLRELKRIERGVRIPVSVPIDEDGYFDRICHAEPCRSEFRVLFQDWREKVSDEKVYCPICRHESPADNWSTDKQVEYMKKVAVASVQDVIHSALTKDAREFNRTQRSGFVRLSMSAKRGTRPIIVPYEIADVMRQKFICEVCSCRYASIGTAFFCPACGHNSVITTFDKTLETVREVALKATSIRSTLAVVNDEDFSQDFMRNILEDSLMRLVGAFQQFAEALFDTLPEAAAIKRSKNAFQNLDESCRLWNSAVGETYRDMVSEVEFQEMNTLFQKRHLIAHRNGIVDAEYISKSGDRSVAVGQRLVIQEAMILHFVELLSTLAGELRKVVKQI